MKALWNDYWSKWNKERVGEELRRNVFLYTWFGLLIAPVVNHCIFAEWIPGILMGMVSGICIEFVMLSTVLHPIGLSKAQYLFPMTEDERRKKMIQDYLFSRGIHIALFLVVDLVAVLMGVKGIYILSAVIHQTMSSLVPMKTGDKVKSVWSCVELMLGALAMNFSIFTWTTDVAKGVVLIITLCVMIPIYVASLWMVCRSFETKEYYEEVA